MFFWYVWQKLQLEGKPQIYDTTGQKEISSLFWPVRRDASECDMQAHLEEQLWKWSFFQPVCRAKQEIYY